MLIIQVILYAHYMIVTDMSGDRRRSRSTSQPTPSPSPGAGSGSGPSGSGAVLRRPVEIVPKSGG